MLKTGDTLKRYRIEGRLGQGGMGDVYRAWDLELKRAVAVKVLRADKALAIGETVSPDGRGRMMREARAAAALHHPNAVSIFDVGEVDGSPFIVLELVEGKSLREMCGDARVPLKQRMRWLLEIARALAAAHERRLVHRHV